MANPWVIALLHRHFPLVLILQITMFFQQLLLIVPAHENSFWKRLQSNGYLSSRQYKWLPIEVCQRIQMDRGEYHYFTSGDQIELIRWNNNVVTIGSSAVSVEPVGNVNQWKQGKGSVNVWQPHAIKAYNKCMGGVDLVDCALSDLRHNFNHTCTQSWICILLAITPIVHKAKKWSEVFPSSCSSSCVDESSQ